MKYLLYLLVFLTACAVPQKPPENLRFVLIAFGIVEPGGPVHYKEQAVFEKSEMCQAAKKEVLDFMLSLDEGPIYNFDMVCLPTTQRGFMVVPPEPQKQYFNPRRPHWYG